MLSIFTYNLCSVVIVNLVNRTSYCCK